MTFAIAHRGLHDSSARPENSLAAISAALEHVDVVEIDVRCTHDGVPVCTHDSTLARTHSDPRTVGQLSRAEILELAPDVPTLSEVLELLHDRAGAAMLDVKSTRPRAISAIEEAVDASPLSWNTGEQLRSGEPIDPGSLTFQSHDRDLLRGVRDRTGAGCVLLVPGSTSTRGLLGLVASAATSVQGVTIPDTLVARTTLRNLRRLRLGTYVYTVNDPERYAELASLGACGVYTDCADLLV